jgi:hypothetical protein
VYKGRVDLCGAGRRLKFVAGVVPGTGGAADYELILMAGFFFTG